MRRTLTYALIALAACCGLALVSAGILIGLNNLDRPMPDDTRLSASMTAATDWLEANSAELLSVENPILWYFVVRAAEVSGDQKLAALAQAHREKYIEPRYGRYLWGAMFDPSAVPVQLEFASINALNYYSQHMAYATNCDARIGQLASIQAQNDAGFCGPMHVFRPTCVTHQLMGIRFLQRSQCSDAGQNQQTVSQLQAMTRRELVFDPRVLDVYIQRALMLVESGSAATLKGVWVERILSVQNDDGGWGNFVSVVRLSEDFHVGIGYGKSRTGRPRAGTTYLKFVGTGKPRSTFHATAQGVLLLALLLSEEKAETE